MESVYIEKTLEKIVKKNLFYKLSYNIYEDECKFSLTLSLPENSSSSEIERMEKVGQICSSALSKINYVEVESKVDAIKMTNNSLTIRGKKMLLSNNSSWKTQYDTIQMLIQRGVLRSEALRGAYANILTKRHIVETKQTIKKESADGLFSKVYQLISDAFASPFDVFDESGDENSEVLSEESYIYSELLFEAAVRGEVLVVEDLLKNKLVSLAQKSSKGKTVFDVAFNHGHFAVVQSLIKHAESIGMSASLGSIYADTNLHVGILNKLTLSQRMHLLRHFPSLSEFKYTMDGFTRIVKKPDLGRIGCDLKKNIDRLTLTLTATIGDLHKLRKLSEQYIEYFSILFGSNDCKVAVVEPDPKLVEADGCFFEKDKNPLLNKFFLEIDLTNINGKADVSAYYKILLENLNILDHVVVLVGTNAHLKDQRKISRVEAEQLAEEWKVPYLECDDITEINRTKIFNALSKTIAQKDVPSYFIKIDIEILKPNKNLDFELLHDVASFLQRQNFVIKRSPPRHTYFDEYLEEKEGNFYRDMWFMKTVNFLKEQGYYGRAALFNLLLKNITNPEHTVSAYALTVLKDIPLVVDKLLNILSVDVASKRQEAVQGLKALSVLQSEDVIRGAVRCFDRLSGKIEIRPFYFLEKVNGLSLPEIVEFCCCEANPEAFKILKNAGYFEGSCQLGRDIYKTLFIEAIECDRYQGLVLLLLKQSDFDVLSLYSARPKKLSLLPLQVELYLDFLCFLEKLSKEDLFNISGNQCASLVRLTGYPSTNTLLIEAALRVCLNRDAIKFVYYLFEDNKSIFFDRKFFMSLYSTSEPREQAILFSCLVQHSLFSVDGVSKSLLRECGTLFSQENAVNLQLGEVNDSFTFSAKEALKMFSSGLEDSVDIFVNMPLNIKITHAGLNDQDLSEVVIPFLNKLKHVKNLDLSDNFITERGLKKLILGLHQPELCELVLRKNLIECSREVDWNESFDKLLSNNKRRKFPALKRIDLTDNFIRNLNRGLVVSQEKKCSKTLYQDVMRGLLYYSKLSFDDFLKISWGELNSYHKVEADLFEKLINLQDLFGALNLYELFVLLKRGLSRYFISRECSVKGSDKFFELYNSQQQEVLNGLLKYHDNAALHLQLTRHAIYQTNYCDSKTVLFNEPLSPSLSHIYLFADKVDEHAMLGFECMALNGQRIFKVAHLTTDGESVSISYLNICLENVSEFLRAKYDIARFETTYAKCKSLWSAIDADVCARVLNRSFQGFIWSSNRINCLKWAKEKIQQHIGYELDAHMSVGYVPSVSVRNLLLKEEYRPILVDENHNNLNNKFIVGSEWFPPKLPASRPVSPAFNAETQKHRSAYGKMKK